jgi:hypothetical protein
MTTTPSPKQVVRAASGDYDAFLHDHYIGSFRSELHAWTELNRVQFEQTRHGIAVDIPPNVSDDTPPPMVSTDVALAPLPIPVAALEAAAARLRPDPAIHKALKRLLEGSWTCHEDDALTITFDPRSRGHKGKVAKPYTTTAESCTCPGAVIRGGCYHPVAWLIVNEARTPTTSLQCALPSAMFLPLALLMLSCGTQVVTVCADSGSRTLTLRSSPSATVTIAVEMATSVLLVIEQQLHAADLKRVIDGLADALPPQGDQLLLEVDTSTLMIVAGTEDTPTFVDGLTLLPMDVPPIPLA